MHEILYVTFAFVGIRTDRPSEYYIESLRRLLLLSKSGCSFVVFTNAPSFFKEFSSVQIIQVEPEDIASLFFKTNIADAYFSITHKECSPQTSMRRLITVYLSKIPAITSLAHMAKLIVWFDSGHVISYQGQHYFSDSKLQLVKGISHNASQAIELSMQTCTVLAHRAYHCLAGQRFHMAEGEMNLYAQELGYSNQALVSFVAATFLVVKTSALLDLSERYKYWVKRLIADKKEGWTEENIYTLLAWDSKDFSYHSYGEFCKLLFD